MKKIALTKSALREFLGLKENEELTELHIAEMLVKYHIVMVLVYAAVIVNRINIRSRKHYVFRKQIGLCYYGGKGMSYKVFPLNNKSSLN